MKDARGRSTSYEYDAFGRLKLIKDHDGKLLEEYKYHYKGE
nr:RHS repeat domain-containing protein [Zunongwangia pacifica]